MQYQVDFGNLAVGAATFTVALISLWIASRSNGAVKAQKLADYRRDWIENLRGHLSEVHALLLDMLRYNSFHEDGSRMLDWSDRERSEKWSRLAYLSSYVELMLNHNEERHRKLISEMYRMMFDAKEEDSLKEFRQLSREILKEEWEKLKNEIQTQ